MPARWACCGRQRAWMAGALLCRRQPGGWPGMRPCQRWLLPLLRCCEQRAHRSCSRGEGRRLQLQQARGSLPLAMHLRLRLRLPLRLPLPQCSRAACSSSCSSRLPAAGPGMTTSQPLSLCCLPSWLQRMRPLAAQQSCSSLGCQSLCRMAGTWWLRQSCSAGMRCLQSWRLLLLLQRPAALAALAAAAAPSAAQAALLSALAACCTLPAGLSTGLMQEAPLGSSCSCWRHPLRLPAARAPLASLPSLAPPPEHRDTESLEGALSHPTTHSHFWCTLVLREKMGFVLYAKCLPRALCHCSFGGCCPAGCCSGSAGCLALLSSASSSG
jgi:hypothetical protein